MREREAVSKGSKQGACGLLADALRRVAWVALALALGAIGAQAQTDGVRLRWSSARPR
jgi:hypothetical protein